MDRLTTMISSPYQVRVPPVVRYLDAQYVDAFFADGSLRLSSFGAFRRHPDEALQDSSEGRTPQKIYAPNGVTSIAGISEAEVYVLCATTIEGVGFPSEWFTGHGIRILRPLSFAGYVARRIPGFCGGIQGVCSYSAGGVVRKVTQKPIPPPGSGEDVEQWGEAFDRDVAQESPDAFFTKDARHAAQSEYRMLWYASDKEREYLDIRCPEARQWCEHISLSSQPFVRKPKAR